MITRNDAVANRSQGFLEVRKLIERDQVPPAITDRRLAGYLWFAVGGSVGALSRKKLIANCSYVMTPRTDVVSKARQYLNELDPAKADIFVSLMRDQRAQRCLMRSTLGFPGAVRPDNAEDLLKEVRLSVAEELQAQADAREAQLKAEHQAQVSGLTQAQQLEQLQSQSALLRLQQDLDKGKREAAQEIAKRDERVSTLGGRLTALEGVVGFDVDQRIQRAAGSANWTTAMLKSFLTVVYLSAVGAAYWFLPNERVSYALVITLVVALLAFWVVPQFIYDRIARPLWTWRFGSRCRDLGVTEHADGYDIDPARGTAVTRTRVRADPVNDS